MKTPSSLIWTITAVALTSGCMMEADDGAEAVGASEQAIVNPILSTPLEAADFGTHVQIGSKEGEVLNFLGRFKVLLASGIDGEASWKWRDELRARAATGLLNCQMQVYQQNLGTCIGFGDALYVGYCQAQGMCEIAIHTNFTGSPELVACARDTMTFHAQQAWPGYKTWLQEHGKMTLPDGRIEFRIPGLYAGGNAAETDCGGTCSSDTGCPSTSDPNCHCHENQGVCAPGGT